MGSFIFRQKQTIIEIEHSMEALIEVNFDEVHENNMFRKIYL